MALAPVVTKGDCECCDATDVVIRTQHGSIKMCEACIAKEASVVPAVNAIIASSHAVDSTIKLKTDIFTAKTVAVVELHGAIQADDTIPADMKDFKMAEECSKRYQHLKDVIFAKRQELLEAENEARAWQVNTQEFAGKLRTELKEKFKQFDLNYQPPQEKIKKPRATSAPKMSQAEKVKQAREAASKYGVDANAVLMTMVSRNMTADDAAKHFAKLLGLTS